MSERLRHCSLIQPAQLARRLNADDTRERIRHAPFVSLACDFLLARVLREPALIISALARAFLSPQESGRP